MKKKNLTKKSNFDIYTTLVFTKTSKLVLD